jgi:hypothetical protein
MMHTVAKALQDVGLPCEPSLYSVMHSLEELRFGGVVTIVSSRDTGQITQQTKEVRFITEVHLPGNTCNEVKIAEFVRVKGDIDWQQVNTIFPYLETIYVNEYDRMHPEHPPSNAGRNFVNLITYNRFPNVQQFIGKLCMFVSNLSIQEKDNGGYEVRNKLSLGNCFPNLKSLNIDITVFEGMKEVKLFANGKIEYPTNLQSIVLQGFNPYNLKTDIENQQNIKGVCDIKIILVSDLRSLKDGTTVSLKFQTTKHRVFHNAYDNLKAPSKIFVSKGDVKKATVKRIPNAIPADNTGFVTEEGTIYIKNADLNDVTVIPESESMSDTTNSQSTVSDSRANQDESIKYAQNHDS